MSKRPIYYDTETTGVSSETDRIVEIAMYDAERDRTFLSLVQPGMPIPAQATAIHKIDDDMVAQAPTFAEVIPQILQFCQGDVVLIAHNNDNFDLLFLKKEFQRAEQPFPEWHFIDTLKWARKYRPDLPRHSLQFLREIYAFAPNQAHRALDDVIMLQQIFQIMIGDLSTDTVLNLLQKVQQSPGGESETGFLINMPFGKHQGKLLKEVPAQYLKWMHASGLLDKSENEQLKKSILHLGLIAL